MSLPGTVNAGLCGKALLAYYEKVYVQVCTWMYSCPNKSSSKLLSRVLVESSLFGDFLCNKIRIVVLLKIEASTITDHFSIV